MKILLQSTGLKVRIKKISKNNFQIFLYYIICIFLGHGGGWGYSAHSIEAIRFMPDTDILLGGYGLFGGRGEYTAKIKVSIIHYTYRELCDIMLRMILNNISAL